MYNKINKQPSNMSAACNVVSATDKFSLAVIKVSYEQLCFFQDSS